ncbi:uncharacterized protein Tco025E_01819 [Trypanosoma conorhini]|uniref:Uncharacterized protein n=1 Tax=Trypanosoma conorhini TaxID=83891 RepID=A0A3R7M3K3_9TRYP|nr:uncharacterized protein Tco025E_01819 [Trypanosoma conorhini]RNF25933.1 hypothetical protein Tco025E_01819 [Trypanosoma conorhini]
MDVVAPRASGKGAEEAEKRAAALARQLRVLLDEREDHLDALEGMQRAVQTSQVEAERLREELRVKFAQVEEVRRRASKEALWLVKSEWRDKLVELARSNTELLHEVRLRDSRIVELQQQMCEFNKLEEKDASLPERVTVLTAELLRGEKIMSEKDAVLYAYEARLERAERATLSALESQCKLEARCRELLQEQAEHLRAFAALSARNEHLETPLAEEKCGPGVGDGVTRTSALHTDMCEEATGTDADQSGKRESLVKLLLRRLAANEAEMQLRVRLLMWMSFVLQKRSAGPRKGGRTGPCTSQAPSPSFRDAPETNDGSNCLEEEVARLRREAKLHEETREQLQFARNELEKQKREHEWKEKANKEREDELSKVIETLLQQLTREPAEIICAKSELSARSNPPSCTSDEAPLSEAKASLSFATLQSVPNASSTQNELIPCCMSTAEKEEKEHAGEALSSAVESLPSLQDGSEVNAVIATLLSLHQEGLEEWRGRALLAEQRMEKWGATVSTLSLLLQRSILPYLLMLDEMYTTAVSDKMNMLVEEYFCRIEENSASMCEKSEFTTKYSKEFIILKYWSNWRLSMGASRLASLREKAARTVSCMAEQYEQLETITQRAMTRIRALEGASVDSCAAVAGI